MKSLFNKGDLMTFSRIVGELDTATFDSGNVHPVLATFALGRDAEWVCRLFVIELKDDDEEGIGTFLEIRHHNPAFIGETVEYTGIFDHQTGNTIVCEFKSFVGNRLIATGRTGQKIIKREKINQLFKNISGKG